MFAMLSFTVERLATFQITRNGESSEVYCHCLICHGNGGRQIKHVFTDKHAFIKPETALEILLVDSGIGNMSNETIAEIVKQDPRNVSYIALVTDGLRASVFIEACCAEAKVSADDFFAAVMQGQFAEPCAVGDSPTTLQ